MSSRIVGGGDTGPWIGSLLRHAWEQVRDRIYRGVASSGHHRLTRAHVGLFRFEPLDGLRPSQLADRMNITKQSVNDLLRDLERFGYVVLRPDRNDKRARLVRLTPQGRRLDAVVRGEAKAAEGELADTIGAARFNALRQSLLDLRAPVGTSDASAAATMQGPALESKRHRKQRKARRPAARPPYSARGRDARRCTDSNSSGA